MRRTCPIVGWLILVVAVQALLPPRPRAVWPDVPPVAWARVTLPDHGGAVLVPPVAGVLPTAPNALVVWDSAAGTHELFSDEDDLPAFGSRPTGPGCCSTSTTACSC